MELSIECLRCGQLRRSQHEECPRCRYVGWAHSNELNERSRRLLRDLPVEIRLRVRAVA